jgi:arginyl-tRNA synthetase
MKNLDQLLQEMFSNAIKKGLGIDINGEISQSANDRPSDYQCNSPMKLGKSIGKAPRDVAAILLENIEDPLNLIEKTEIAGPGFINVIISASFLENAIEQILFDPRLGVPLPIKKERIVCDFSSPNIAKAMHVGHLRSTIIGDSLARLFEFLGHSVLRLNHVGDWGTQFGMLICYLKSFHPEIIEGKKTADLESLMGWYKESKAHFDENPAFKKEAHQEVVKLQSGDPLSLAAWEQICAISRKSYEEIYALLNVEIEERGESFYTFYLNEVVQDFQKAGLLTVDDGAKCVFLEGFTIPIIVQKSDGGFNYATTDLAGFKYRIQKDHADRIIIVTDLGQSLHFKMVAAAAEKVGYLNPQKVRFDHVPFGVVLAPDGKKFKTRSGETERLQDLLDEAIEKAKILLIEKDVENLEEASHILGIGSVKYADLSCNRIKDYTFSYDRMLKFEGNTAAFILYAYVRIQSIKRKSLKDLDLLAKEKKITLSHPAEKKLALLLRQFGETLENMSEELLPNRLTDYLFHVAEAFHIFFRDCRVQGSHEEDSRLLLSEATAKILKKGLFILGIGTLDKM